MGKWQVSKWCGVFAGIGGGAVVMGVLQQYGFACMGQSLTMRLRALLLSSMLRQARCCGPEACIHFHSLERSTFALRLALLLAPACSVVDFCREREMQTSK